MAIASIETESNKRAYKQLVDAYRESDTRELASMLSGFLHEDCCINVAQPINSVAGSVEFLDRVVNPMFASFDHLHRRCDMLFGGEFNGAEWVVSHGHYVGEFQRDWLGIPASRDIVWLHYLEFHRMEAQHAVESYLYLDMLDLLRQIDRWPLEAAMGFEGFVPGPATGDGIVLNNQSPKESATSLKMVDDMLRQLYTDHEGWRPYWHRNMYWYGPSGYGSYVGVDGFARFQLPYESIFDPQRVASTYRRSGDSQLDTAVKGHFARFADGNYVASGGWPSHGGFMVNDWLGIQSSGQRFTVRVSDIWRREGDLLVENWVFVDVIDMLLQLGYDAFQHAGIEVRA